MSQKSKKKNSLSLSLNLYLVFCLAFLSFILSSCGESVVGRQAKSERKDALSVSISTDVSSLDPRFGADATSSQIIKMLFEGLMVLDEEGMPTCAIARSYEISEDRKTYVFYLKDCQWSNGMDITAYDFEYSWKSILDAERKDRSMCAHNFLMIKNAGSFLKNSSTSDEVGIRALDAKTLKVELESPIPYFLEALTNTWFFPVSKVVDQSTPRWSKKGGRDFVCSGPFRLWEHKFNQQIILKKNPLFWDSAKVCLSEVRVNIIKDAMTRLCLFEKGQIDWLGRPLCGIPLDACAILKKEKKLLFAPSLGIYWYFFNTDRFPFCNKKMRKAFYYAICRSEITDNILQSSELPADTILPVGYGLTAAAERCENFPKKAQELFEEALLELRIKKHNLPELTMSYNSDEIHQNVAQIIQHQLYEVLGVRVKLSHTDWRIHYDNLKKGDFCIGGMMWHSWVRDPIYILQTFRSKEDGINMSRWENEEYKRLLDASNNETRVFERRALLLRAHDILMEEMPVMPIYFSSIAYGMTSNLEGALILENSIVDFRYAHFTDGKEPYH